MATKPELTYAIGGVMIINGIFTLLHMTWKHCAQPLVVKPQQPKCQQILIRMTNSIAIESPLFLFKLLKTATKTSV